ncbi:uncharacterized protein LOC128559515 [Mercenaria mercenaria]|uniref:uncharacterized protein LOC128559515 n=1 Tax=Mercenaria mercenaria TaxID=6596 RepID=UPI00234F925B|nr:uncharacterized protein LOC128559515 [Mercenaria mercenaria]
MNGILTAAIAILFHVHVLAFASKGIYCNIEKQSWRNATNECAWQRGCPLAYRTDLGQNLDAIFPSNFNAKTSWTADYLQQKNNGESEQVCGFRYMSNSTDFGQVFYGDCDKNISYICWNEKTSTLQLYTGEYEHAVKTCHQVSNGVLKNIADIFRPGYYWVNRTKYCVKMKISGHYSLARGTFQLANIPDTPFRCGAYSKDIGLYFRNCTDEISSLCYFVNAPSGPVYTSCVKEMNHSTVTTRNIPVVFTSTLAKKTSTAIPVTNIAADIQTHSPGMTTVTTFYIHASSKNGSYYQGPTDKESDFGVQIGVPVGICLALICGVVLGLFMYRRYKIRKDGNNTDSTDFNHNEDSKPSSRRVNAHLNACYEPNDRIHSQASKDVETEHECECDSASKKTNFNYAVVHKNNSKMKSPVNSKAMDCSASSNASEYSFAKEVENYDDNKTEKFYAEESLYDVTSTSTRGDKFTNVYNKLQSEEYDSTANVTTKSSANVYKIPQKLPSDNVYDTTRQTNQLRPPDDIYNHVLGAASNDDLDEYDSTLNAGEGFTLTLPDNTYDKIQ